MRPYDSAPTASETGAGGSSFFHPPPPWTKIVPSSPFGASTQARAFSTRRKAAILFASWRCFSIFSRSAGEKRPRPPGSNRKIPSSSFFVSRVASAFSRGFTSGGSAVRTIFPSSFPFQPAKSSSFSSFA